MAAAVVSTYQAIPDLCWQIGPFHRAESLREELEKVSTVYHELPAFLCWDLARKTSPTTSFPSEQSLGLLFVTLVREKRPCHQSGSQPEQRNHAEGASSWKC